MELSKAIKERRSVREFTDYYVKDEELKEILDAARLSPSWNNNQPWRFIVIRDQELMKEISKRVASVLIVVCAKVGDSGYIDGRKMTKLNEWYMFDLGIATYGLCLKAYELGLGTVIQGAINQEEIEKLLGVPEDYKVIVNIPVGKPAEGSVRKPNRKDFSGIVFKEKFGCN